MIEFQENTINSMKNTEEKMWRLLHAVQKRGLDLEKIYREEVQGPVSALNLDRMLPLSSIGNLDSRKEESRKNSTVEAPSHMEILSVCSIGGDISGMTDIAPEFKDILSGKNLSEAKTSESTPYLAGIGSPFGPNTLAKNNKLKLDFTVLPNQKKGLKLPIGYNPVAQQPDNAEPVGFHDEFMSKLAEFSLSWRQEALKQRNI